VNKRLEERNQLVAAELVLAGERGNEDHITFAIGNEERVDKHRLGKLALSLP
jgi:hypothetical protein